MAPGSRGQEKKHGAGEEGKQPGGEGQKSFFSFCWSGGEQSGSGNQGRILLVGVALGTGPAEAVELSPTRVSDHGDFCSFL